MKHSVSALAIMGGLLAASGAIAQTAGNAAGVLGGTPTTGSIKAPSAATGPAGTAVYKSGQAVTIASGAHGGGPAPIVSGASPQTKDFTSSVTDGTAKVGKGMKGSGEAMQGGVTISPTGAEKGVASAPGGLSQQASRTGQVLKQ